VTTQDVLAVRLSIQRLVLFAESRETLLAMGNIQSSIQSTLRSKIAYQMMLFSYRFVKDLKALHGHNFSTKYDQEKLIITSTSSACKNTRLHSVQSEDGAEDSQKIIGNSGRARLLIPSEHRRPCFRWWSSPNPRPKEP
jgi:hypothetical protein